MGRTRMWTTVEVHTAVRMWKEGATADAIAEALGRNLGSVKHLIRRERERFPPRREERTRQSDGGIKLNLVLSTFLYRTIKARAAEEGISVSMLIRRALRAEIARKNEVKTGKERKGWTLEMVEFASELWMANKSQLQVLAAISEKWPWVDEAYDGPENGFVGIKRKYPEKFPLRDLPQGPRTLRLPHG